MVKTFYTFYEDCSTPLSQFSFTWYFDHRGLKLNYCFKTIEMEERPFGFDVPANWFHVFLLIIITLLNQIKHLTSFIEKRVSWKPDKINLEIGSINVKIRQLELLNISYGCILLMEMHMDLCDWTHSCFLETFASPSFFPQMFVFPLLPGSQPLNVFFLRFIRQG